MSDELDQVDELSPEEQFVKDKTDGLLDKIDGEHGEPLQQELADRLEKTVNEFQEDAAAMIGSLKTKAAERRTELKERWENSGNDQPADERSTEPDVESSDWEKKIESTESENDKISKKAEVEEEPKKKKKFGFFKKKKKEKK